MELASGAGPAEPDLEIAAILLWGYTRCISHLRGLPMPTRTTLFQSNRSQAVRLPKDVAFPPGVREVEILRDGPRRVIVPAGGMWDDFFDAPGIDLPDRDQPKQQEREAL